MDQVTKNIQKLSSKHVKTGVGESEWSEYIRNRVKFSYKYLLFFLVLCDNNLCVRYVQIQRFSIS